MLYMVLEYHPTSVQLVKMVAHNLRLEDAKARQVNLLTKNLPGFFCVQNSTHFAERADECALCYQEVYHALKIPIKEVV